VGFLRRFEPRVSAAVSHAPTVPSVTNAAARAGARVSPSLVNQVQTPLNLVMPLKNPTQMPALGALLQAAADKVHDVLARLHYVHFARFLPMPDDSAILVITTYDGELESYLMDFVALLSDEFTEILQYIKAAPPLPVNRYPREFCDFVAAHDVTAAHEWSAYPDVSVIDVLHNLPNL
jgi:hypothetical protein